MLIRHPKHQPPVTLPQKAAQRVVPVDNHNGMGRSGQSLLQPAGNIGRVGIAEHRVPGQIADHHIVRLKRREVQGEISSSNSTTTASLVGRLKRSTASNKHRATPA